MEKEFDLKSGLEAMKMVLTEMNNLLDKINNLDDVAQYIAFKTYIDLCRNAIEQFDKKKENEK